MSNPKKPSQTTKIAELTDDLQRTRADFENYRRQVEAQKAHLAESVAEDTVKKLLPLVDDFDRATKAQPEVMAPLAKNFVKTLQALGLQTIDSQPGTAFNPELHFATSVEGDGEAEIIAETLQTGYYYQGNVIRPALVKVKKQ